MMLHPVVEAIAATPFTLLFVGLWITVAIIEGRFGGD